MMTEQRVSDRMTGEQRSDVEQDPTLRLSVEGETVAATRYEPVDVDGPLPGVLWYTPYHKDDETTHGRYGPLLEYVAAHGYEVVVADMVGTGASTGVREGLVGPEVGEEVAAVVEAIADRPWTTDRVGMLGKSFPGNLCLSAAVENPDPLAAVVPILTTHRSDRVAFESGGLPKLWLPLSMIAVYATSGVQPPSRRPPDWESTWRARLDHLRDAVPPLASALAPDAGTDDPPWDWVVPVDDVDVPTFAVGGYRDHFAAATTEYVAAIDAEKRLLLGPWRHVLPYRGRETAVGFRGQVVDWFDRFLKDRPVEPFEPTVAYWTGREGGRAVDAGRWRGRSTWPTVDDADVNVVSFAATPEGLERTGTFDTGAVERTHEVDHTVGLDAHDLAVPFVDTNADDARSTTFETARLAHPVELTGTGEATVRLSADGPMPLSVRLVDVAPDGRARPITRGASRVDDTAGPATVPLAPVSHVVESGHRLRMAVSAADFPSYVPLGTAESFVVTSTPDAPTTVRIPGREDVSGTFEDTVSMSPPDGSFPLIPPAVEGYDTAWETTREHERGSATRHRGVTTDLALPHVGKRYDLAIEASVATDDPETLSATATVEATLDHPDDPVAVEVTVHRGLDGGTVAATVRRDGATVFDHEWSV